MNIDEITNGIVIDHITAGRAMEIYDALGLDLLSCPVAIIKNVHSKKTGLKDIIKVDAKIKIDLDVLGYIDPDITVNLIEDGVIVEKRHLELPKRIVNIIKCKNPRCITSTEQEIDHVFTLTDKKNRVYRCIYCEGRAKEETN